ncbi:MULTISPECIES: SDR family oxidoreductase [Nocardia]|jgi:NAD(P)-dependent dehydrogenase (short-subunit alcohol dehydrogenase family)|uniref:Short chain dehydrogenase n=2 Tax=Nocardia TaxID=1817 RepID=A0A2T2ZBR3_9NOCA|nr:MULTISPECIES: SDR family oxidoreductase [Nocardia]MBF6447657.1 SDR family oxidoreductase [Nocardia elegans]PSR65190.1 short chain dehydrogenase [Nocardia nova]
MTDTPHTLVIGGSSGMGLALAQRLLAAGHRITIAARDTDRLTAATAHLGYPDQVRSQRVDIAEEASIAALFDTIGTVDHVVVTAADMRHGYGPLTELPARDARTVLDIKVLGPWLAAKYAADRVRNSITVTSGIAAYRPAPGGSVVATANAALEGLVRALALELAPIRVNAVSPGWVDTPIWDDFAGPDKHARLAAMAARLPAGRVGRPADIAAAFHAVLDNDFMTGEVLHVEGGHRLV